MVANPDIEETILAALGKIFQYELIDQMAGDPLQLHTLKESPLQDDPTQVAPYLVYGPNNEKTMHLDHENPPEIGGPLHFIHHFFAKFGTPLGSTRDIQYSNIAILNARVVGTLVKYYDLAGVLIEGPCQSPDQSKVIEGANPNMIDENNTSYRIYGGEQTWYGEGKVTFHYPVSWYQPFRIFTGSSTVF